MSVLTFPPFPMDCLENSKERLVAILANNLVEIDKLLTIANKSYVNFIKPLMEISNGVDIFFMPISHLNGVLDSPKSRSAFSDCLPILSDYSTKLSQDVRLYEATLDISKTSNLALEQKKVIDNHLQAFRLGGVNLDDENKLKIQQINAKMSELSDKFSKNLIDSTNSYELILKDDSAFKNMPESDKSVAKTKDGYRFTLQAPSYIAFMTFCSDRALREATYKAYMTRALNNKKVIEELLTLRQEKADILGFSCFAELINEKMSAPTVTNIIDFISKLVKKGKPYAELEFTYMQSFAQDKGYESVESYDTTYFSNLIKLEKFMFDEEAYRPYFEVNQVVNGLFEALNKLFSIDFKHIKDTPVWHECVKCYDLYKNGEVFGRLYLDLESRAEKRSGAWMDNWQTNHIDSKGEKHLPIVFIVANFPPSANNEPSFLRHDDVTTLFHEAGHAIHHLFSTVEELDISGINGVEWDAVEFPSQFFENFAYEPTVLSLFARHYDTSEPISDEMVQKLVDNKNFQSGMFLLRQLEFSLFDMLIHLRACTFDEVHSLLEEVRKDIAVITPPDYVMFETSFLHIFAGGYAAGYYSYKWAEMLSADAFLAFSNAGTFDKKLAEHFYQNILSKGGSEPMSALFEKFMGRKPEPEALLKLLGISEN